MKPFYSNRIVCLSHYESWSYYWTYLGCTWLHYVALLWRLCMTEITTCPQPSRSRVAPELPSPPCTSPFSTVKSPKTLPWSTRPIKAWKLDHAMLGYEKLEIVHVPENRTGQNGNTHSKHLISWLSQWSVWLVWGYSGKDLWKLKQERPELFGVAPAAARLHLSLHRHDFSVHGIWPNDSELDHQVPAAFVQSCYDRCLLDV